MKRLLFLTIIFLATPFVANGATEFVSVIDPDNGSGTDYTSLSAWEAANQVDLTSVTTLVIAGSLTRGTIADGVAITQTTTGATAVCVHHTTTQMLISTLVGTPDATSTWYPTANGSDVTNAWTPTDVGDSAIAVAKCRSTAGTADTTVVSIDGWTTSATNYIKVWTDPSENYRHQGKWDEGKYRMEASNALISISEENIKIDGLQIYTNNNASYPYGVRVNGIVGVANVEVANSVIKGFGNYTWVNSGAGISLTSGASSSVVKVWNNIIYDFAGAGNGSGISSNDSDVAVYVYNNTDYNCNYGIRREAGTLISKNNISYNNTNNYAGTFDASSTNNLSGPGADADVPATNARNGYVVQFADEANDDFHLDSADTGARNQGIILYDSGDDANLNFTTDVDNNARLDSVGTWDIGADEAITKVYRSVGPSATTAVATGATYGNVEIKPAYVGTSTTNIADYVATFWSDLPTNVGVGDALQYDDDDDGDIDASDSIVFITKRIDASHFSVRTASGTAPASTLAPDSNWSLFRAYTALSKAESASTNADENDSIDDDLENFDNWSSGRNIVTSQEQWNIACYAGQGGVADTVATTITSWTTSADSYIKIYTPTRSDEVGTSQRHSGVWDDGKYKINNSSGDSILIYATYLRIDGIQIDDAESDYLNCGIQAAGSFASEKVFISNSILKNSGSGAAGGISIEPSSGSFYIWNNIIYGFNNAIQFSNTAIGYIYNNTMNDMTNYSGIRNQNNNSILYAKNNIVQGSPSSAYSGIFQTGSDYNISDDTSTTGGAHDKVSQTVAFADSANFDFRLAVSDTSAKNAGTDLSNDPYIPFNTDITSTCLRKDKQSRVASGGDDLCYTRPRGASWDIGAHELITKIYRSVAPDADGNMAAIDDDNSLADTLSIATSGTATFEVAVADNVGVGDALVWDDDDDNDLDSSDTILFIHGRTDSTHYTVRTETGALPTAATTANDKWALYRAYTSLSLAETGTKNTAIPISFTGGNRDIATNSEQWNIACYANGTEADTTAVTISGWTTAAQNYIRIFTPTLTSEVGTSQRHNGKWDDNKYHLTINATADSQRPISITDEYVRVDGLQMYIINNGYSFCQGVNLNDISSSNYGYISNNIIKSVSTVNSNAGIAVYDNDTNVNIWNNVIYNFNIGTAGYGIYIYGSNKVNAYNNTIIDSYNGIYAGDHIVAKNNIVKGSGNTNAYSGNFISGTDYNSTDGTDTTGQGANSRISQTFSFVDETNDDFHLLPSDTGARNFGIDLSQDYWIPASAGMTSGGSGITSDIDGQDRFLIPNSQFSIPDIGADESATPIYRSIAPSMSTYLDRGVDESGTDLTISGTTMTLENAAPDNVGVGDAIQYDSDGNSSIDVIAFISARASSTSFTVQSAKGGLAVPTSGADQDWQIFRAYTTLDNAEGGVENTANIDDDVDDFDISVSRGDGKDIYASNEQWNIAAYANGATADTVAVAISGWTTYLTNYIKIYTPVSTNEVGTSQRHEGKWDDAVYKLEVSNYGYNFYANLDNIRLDGIQLYNSYNAGHVNIIYITNGNGNIQDMQFSNNIIRGSGVFSDGNSKVGIGTIGLDPLSGSTVKVWDNIIYGLNGTSITGRGIYITKPTRTFYAYNNTIYDVDDEGIYAGAGATIAKNNIVQASDGNAYDGTFTSSNYNISDDATNTGGANDKVSQTVQFSDAANSDFHLASTDTSAKNAGADLSADADLAFSSDIDGDTRPIGSGWDIGADEFNATQKLKFRGDVKMRGDVKIR